MTLDEWKQRASRGTSGDMVDDMLMDWEAENRALHSQVEELLDNLSRCKGNELANQLEQAQAKITALEAINKHNIEDECELEDMLVKAGIPDYEPSGDYKGLTRQMAEFISAYLAQQQRITQLEGALKDVIKRAQNLCDDCIGDSESRDSLLYGIKHAQNLLSSRWSEATGQEVERRVDALTPGVYREWCRDPKLCQDKGTCPKDPTCAD
jgi:hypothetical protein